MLAGILSKIQQYLDATISSRAPSSTALSNSTWTNSLASNLGNRVDATISSRAPSSTALSNATWPDSLAAALALLKKIPTVKVETGGIVDYTFGAQANDMARYFHLNNQYWQHYLSVDRTFGYRLAMSLDGSDALVDVVNISGSGYVFGVMAFNQDSGTGHSIQTILTADGVQVYDSTLATLPALSIRLAIGSPETFAGTYQAACIATVPLRFNSTLRVQRRSNSVTVRTSVVYILD